MRGETFRVFRRQRAFFHILAHAHMYRLALTQQHTIGLSQNAIPELDHRPARSQQPSLNHQFIIVACWSAKPYMRIDNRNSAPVFLFHLPVIQPKLPNELHPPHLKPDQVVRVVYHSHLVGLHIPHPHPRFTRRPYSFDVTHSTSLLTNTDSTTSCRP